MRIWIDIGAYPGADDGRVPGVSFDTYTEISEVMEKDRLAIAVIDDGINEGYFRIGDLLDDVEVASDLSVRKRAGMDSIENSHGTTCAAIIRKFAPDSPLVSVKVLNDERKCSKEQLVKALEWCVENGIRVVSLSLGTIDARDYELMRNAINEVHHNGCIIIAAQSNRNVFTYVASLSNVIGVRSTRGETLATGEFLFDPLAYDCVEVTCGSEYVFTDYTGNEVRIPPANSYSAPLITAVVFNLLRLDPSIGFERIRELLYGLSALQGKEYVSFYRNIDWIRNARVVRLASGCEDVLCGDFVFNATGLDTILCTDLDAGLRGIEALVDSSQFYGVDALVVFVENCIARRSKTAIESFFAFADERGINTVLLDDNASEDRFDASRIKNIRIYHPGMEKIDFSHWEPEEIDAPVIMLIDTNGNVKRLVSLVTSLSGCFSRDGYRALSVTDSCFGKAYGAQYLPEGADPANSLSYMYALYDPDLIVYGSAYPGSSRDNNPPVDVLIVSCDEEPAEAHEIEKRIRTEETLYIYAIESDRKGEGGGTFYSGEERFMDRVYTRLTELFGRE